jgi:hypothetical protein
VSKEELKKRVDAIIEISDDDVEAAHSDEDKLHRELLDKYLPHELWVEIVRLNNANFSRWCA